MPTVGADLDLVQLKLHDAGTLWSRAELLKAYVDGYRELLASSHAVRRLHAIDLPGRHTYAITYEWEDRHAGRGTVRKPSRTAKAAAMQAWAMWEVQHLADVTPSGALAGHTQEWERAYGSQTDRHYRFTFPHNHERIARLQWNNRKLSPVSIRELDDTDSDWSTRVGEPRWWSTGTGRIRSVEIHEVQTTDVQTYALLDGPYGVPRGFTGARTYAVAHPAPPANGYAYTTQGDAQALSPAGRPFEPSVMYTYGWEKTLGHVDAAGHNPVIDLTYLGVGYVVIHPWEASEVSSRQLASDPASPGLRGMWPWERLDPEKAYEARTQHGTLPPTLRGLGLRITVAATDPANGYGTQAWEADIQNGATTLTAGAVRGAFTWEDQHGAPRVVLGIGGIRQVVSPDRQYWPATSDAQPRSLCGRVVEWHSSEDALMVTEVVLPDHDVTEQDTPALIPAPLQKYLRYFVLHRAFARPGEGRQAILADHYLRRYKRGVAFFRQLADVAHKDRQYVREPFTPAEARRPRVRLPSTYPSVWG